ncbi:MAG: PH domain-containing protein [Candidatus Nanohalobium sp.]
MSDIQELLTQGEQVEVKTSPSMLDTKFIGHYIVASLLFVGIIALALTPGLLGLNISSIYFLVLLLLPVAVVLKSEVQRRFVQYYITNQQVIMRRGILNQKTESTMYNNITDVTLNKKFNERIFDVGDIKVNTAGHDGTTLILNGVKGPEEYKRKIENNIQQQNSGQRQQQGFQNNGNGNNGGLGGGDFGNSDFGDSDFGDDDFGF